MYYFVISMKNIILVITVLSLWNSVYCQNTNFFYKNFESEILLFRPQKKQHITQQRFDYACMVLTETKKATGNNPSNFNLADYFNICLLFSIWM